MDSVFILSTLAIVIVAGFALTFIGAMIYGVYDILRNKGWHWLPAALVALVGGPIVAVGAWLILALGSGFTLWG